MNTPQYERMNDAVEEVVDGLDKWTNKRRCKNCKFYLQDVESGPDRETNCAKQEEFKRGDLESGWYSKEGALNFDGFYAEGDNPQETGFIFVGGNFCCIHHEWIKN